MAGSRGRWSPRERALREAGRRLIAGVDEVGRGPLAGPVVACAVVMPPDARAIAGVADSKQLDPAERTRLAAQIRRRALGIGLGAASVREIDRLNIYHATVLAMRRALARLPIAPDHVLVDGKPLRTLGVDHTAVVGGDDACYCIACASIVAKVTRDRLMIALGARHPGYDWARNVGYGTPAHRRALAEAGLTPHHRRSFAPVGQLVLDLALPLPASAFTADLAADDTPTPSDAQADAAAEPDLGAACVFAPPPDHPPPEAS